MSRHAIDGSVLLAEDHGEQFLPRSEPFYGKIVTEEFVNERNPGLARQTDQGLARPLPAPGTRDAQNTVAFTERVFGPYDEVLTGEKTVIPAGAQPDFLQDQAAWDSWHVNTFRTEPMPWDEDLLG